MKWFILAISIWSIGCAKNSSDDTSAPAANHGLKSIPAECTLSSTGAHSFLEWGAEQASSYSCNEISGMNCTLAVSADHSELVCQNVSGQTPTMPTACLPYGPQGAHEWLDDQTVTLTSGYDCGVWQNALRCFFFKETNGTHFEMRCLDNELP